MKKHDEGYLLANIAIVEEQLKKKNIQNVPAYLLSALKTDFRPVETEYSRSQEAETAKKQGEQQRKEQERLQMQQAKDQYESERKAAIEEAWQQLTKNEQGALLQGFLLEHENNLFFQKWYKLSGLSNPFVHGRRQAFIAKKLLPEQLHSLEQYVAFHFHIEVEKQGEI